jgi:TetR/AcrR family transcriptional repressor of bet genes
MPKKDAAALRQPELINATLECIVDVGIEAVTLEMVARQAGCSKGVAAYHFATKQQLIVASLQAFLASYQARLQDERLTTAQDWLNLLVDTALPPWTGGIQSSARPGLPGAAPGPEAAINVFPRPDPRAIVISPRKKARLFVNFIARACQDEEVRLILAERYASDTAGIGAILAAVAAARAGGGPGMDGGPGAAGTAATRAGGGPAGGQSGAVPAAGMAGPAGPDADAYRFLALVYGLAFFRVADFFPAGCSDNRHILIREFGGKA